MNRQIALALLVTMSLAACGGAQARKAETRSSPAPVVQARIAPAASGGYLEGDGPGADVPANLDAIPDAVPKAEPLHRYANRPYTALGKNYTPLAATGNYKKRGSASWYGKKFHGRRTSIGEIYDMYAMTAAHPTLPIPSYVRVTNVANGKSVVVRVNDRGPFLHGRIIDLSYAAAYKLDFVRAGSAEVEVESLTSDAIPAAIALAEPVLVTPLHPATPPVASLSDSGSGKVYLQLGAFESQQGAESFLMRMREEFEGSGKRLVLYQKGDDLVRVHIGPYTTQDEARATAESLQSRLGFKPFVSVH